MIEVNQLCGQLYLGKQGENLARIVYFDEHATWVKEFGEGKCELLHQRNGDSAPYPVKLEMEDDRCCWKITASDTAVVGDGKCELHFLIDDVIVKSKIWTTTVLESLSGDIVEVPEPQKAWVDDVLNAAVRAEDAAERAEEAAENGGTGGGGTGQDGFSPIATVTQTSTGATISITDVNGTTKAVVNNGKDGVDGKDGKNGEDGKDGIDGKDGKDGISVTHSWDGTVLTITSASGTSSADLKCENSENALEFWQPNTDYKVGDVCVAENDEIVGGGFVIIECKENHTSTGYEYYNIDSGYWETKKYSNSMSADNAMCDNAGRIIHEVYLAKEEASNTYAKMATINVTYVNGAVMTTGLPTFDELMALLPAALTENKRILYVNLQYIDENCQQKFATGHMAFDQQNWWFVSELIGDGKLYTLTVKEGDVWDVAVSELGGSGNITVDNTPTEGSENPISSGAVYEAIIGSWEESV